MESSPGGNQTKSATLREVEEAWLLCSAPEEFWFDGFQNPTILRRSNNFRGGLADLKFGRYQNMKGDWLDNDRVVWLSMIASDVPGSGAQLLQSITRVCGRANLAVVGTPTPLKPNEWDPSRHFDYSVNRLVQWYMKHGFRIIQNSHETRIIFAPTSSALTVDFSLF